MYGAGVDATGPADLGEAQAARLAQLRYTPPPPVGGRWRLYWADRNGRWHPLEGIPPAATPAPLLAHIDTDPIGILWGGRPPGPVTRRCRA
jgi:hypothetical protein